jgi:hypothetical protein
MVAQNSHGLREPLLQNYFLNRPQAMSAAVATTKSMKPGFEEAVVPNLHHIRITLTSRHVSRIEAGMLPRLPPL